MQKHARSGQKNREKIVPGQVEDGEDDGRCVSYFFNFSKSLQLVSWSAGGYPPGGAPSGPPPPHPGTDAHVAVTGARYGGVTHRSEMCMSSAPRWHGTHCNGITIRTGVNPDHGLRTSLN